MSTLKECILEFYDNVIDLYGAGFVINERNVSKAMKKIRRIYKSNPEWLNMEEYIDTNFSSPPYRYAYLHKYGMCHTGMTHQLLYKALQSNTRTRLLNKIDKQRPFKFCSLGGGPGCDVVAILRAFADFIGFFQCSVTVIDSEMRWEKVFAYCLEELREGTLGADVKEVVSAEEFTYEYMRANLLRDVHKHSEIREQISNADFLSMVKFISASACWRTRDMLHVIFKCMKPGALIMYIDDSGSGFLKLVKTVAKKCKLKSVYGPIERVNYHVPLFKRKVFGHVSDYRANISFQIWKKNPRKTLFHRSKQTWLTLDDSVSESSESSSIASEDVTSVSSSSESSTNAIPPNTLETEPRNASLNIDAIPSPMELDNIPNSESVMASLNDEVRSSTISVPEQPKSLNAHTLRKPTVMDSIPELCSAVPLLSLSHFSTKEREQISKSPNNQQQDSLRASISDSESDTSFTSASSQIAVTLPEFNSSLTSSNTREQKKQPALIPESEE